MAASKNKKRKKKKGGGRKLEFAIYIAGVLLVCLVVLGIVKGIRALTGGGKSSDSSTDLPESTVSETMQNEVGTSSATISENTASSNNTFSAPADSSAAASSAVTSSQTSTQTASSPSSSQPAATNNGDYVNYTKTGSAELDEWYLFLVNPEKTIDSDWIADMTYIDSEYRLDSRIVTAYKDMVAAATDDGVNLYPISCYRSYDTQTRLYNNRVDRAKRENPSFTQQQAEVYAATHVARPGTSEHQTGLAIDFNSVETDFGSTEAGKWLKEHANDYGFILRYEKDKQSITGVTWEPWHYRFVGVKHAKRMTELGYCLEEYVDYLKNGGQ